MPYADIRTAGLWRAIQQRVNTQAMRVILGSSAAAPRIHLAYDDYLAQEGPEGAAWGRLVIVPTQTLWQSPREQPGQRRAIGWLVRIDYNPVHQPGYDVNVPLQAAQAEAYAQLQDWVPTTPVTGATVAFPFYRATPPQDIPLWDEPRGLWYNSAEYHTEVSRAS
jgi:hypothetical protein